MFIIDEVIENLKKSRSLNETSLSNPETLILMLGRDGTNSFAVIGKWTRILKPWLLQYYNKSQDPQS